MILWQKWGPTTEGSEVFRAESLWNCLPNETGVVVLEWLQGIVVQIEGRCDFSLGWVILLLWFYLKWTWSRGILGRVEGIQLGWAGTRTASTSQPSMVRIQAHSARAGRDFGGACRPWGLKGAADLGCDRGTGLAGCRRAGPWNGFLSPTPQQRQSPVPALPGSQSVCGAHAHAVPALGYSSPGAGSAASSHPKLITLQSFQGTPTLCGS